MNQTFMGYIRPDGSVGIRNHVVVVPTTACAAGVVQRIAREVPELTPMLHTLGCGRPAEVQRLQYIMGNVLSSPNHYAVILVGLGCEGMFSAPIEEAVRSTGKPVSTFLLQRDGGLEECIRKAVRQARIYLDEAAKCRREPCPLSKLIIGTECGSSDGLSGPLANQLIGYVSDYVVALGGTSLLTESIELIGTADILAGRAVSPNVAQRVRTVVDDADRRLSSAIGWKNAHCANSANLAGEITTAEEKGLGCVKKGGTSPVTDVIGYAEPVRGRTGLIVADGPVFDTESLAGLYGSGAQIVLFSTGRGNPIGYPTAPVIKISSNDTTYALFAEATDVNAGRIVSEKLSVAELGEETIALMLRILNGEPSASERFGQGGLLCIQTTTAAV